MLKYDNHLTAKEYCYLREAVGWVAIQEDQAQSGLDHTNFIITCRDGENIVGAARILWDKGYIAYLADVMVKPEYQKQGIGKKMVQECISYIDSELKEGWRVKIVLLAAKGKEAFYDKFGFEVRPNENDGAAMQMWRE